MAKILRALLINSFIIALVLTSFNTTVFASENVEDTNIETEDSEAVESSDENDGNQSEDRIVEDSEPELMGDGDSMDDSNSDTGAGNTVSSDDEPVAANDQEQAENQNNPVLTDEEEKNIELRIQYLGAKAEQFDYGKPADFIFVIDSTGSMGTYIESVRSNLSFFVNYLNDKDVDIRLAVIDYKDIIEDGNDSTLVHTIDGEKWSDDSSKIVDQFNSIYPDGGGDNPETPTDAFAKIIDSDIVWRDDAQKFVFLLTDDDYKDSSDSNSIRSMDECVAYFRNNGVHVTIVGQLAFEEHFEKLFRLTGGKYIDINSSDYYKLMIDIADWVYESVSDTDGDGLPDDWEINGVDTDNDGTIDLDLKRMGADPKVKDIFVEIDWMYQPYIPGHVLWIEYTKQSEINLHPSEGAMRKVYDQFKKHGINLHIDAGPDSTDYVTGRRWGDLSAGNRIPYERLFSLGNNYENWNETALAHFARNRWSVFKYCIFINRFNEDGNSGLAEDIPGQFFLVADVDGGISKTDTKLAGTFMHELGHTLGLGHGGNDHIGYKPNYLSIMNYLFQFSGLSGTKEVNYSEYILPELNENSLDERRGVDPDSATRGTGLGTKWYYEKENRFLWIDLGNTIEEAVSGSIAGTSIDFNRNRTIENGISVNLNKNAETVLPESTNDWNRLIFDGGLIGGLGEADTEETTVLIKKNADITDEMDELSIDEAFELGLLGNPGDCEIKTINPSRIYNNIDDQKLFITVSNLTSEETSPEIIITSDLLESPYKSVLNLPGSKENLVNTVVEVPVKENLEEGTYTVECKLSLDNGTIETKVEEIQVLQALVLELEVGDSKDILPDTSVNSAFVWEGSNDAVTVSENGKIFANKEGSTIVIGTTEDNDQLVCIVKAVQKSGSGNQEETDSKPAEQEDSTKSGEQKDNTGSTEKKDNKGSKSANQKEKSSSKSNKTGKGTKTVSTGDESHVTEYCAAFFAAAISIVLFVRKKYHS